MIGPMAIAIVAVDDQGKLRALGVRDSKKLSPSKRKRLFGEVMRLASCAKHVLVPPEEIDRYVVANQLNELEMKKMMELIQSCSADVVYVDSPDPKPERFGGRLEAATGRRVIAMNEADALIPVVSAASIVAKVIRDGEIDKLKKQYGDFGSGYPSDPRTTSFLESWVKEHGDLPPIVRRTWRTVDRLLGGMDKYLA